MAASGTPDGWVEISGLVSPEACLQIVAECEQRFAPDAADRHPRDKPVAGTRHLEQLDQRIPLVAEMASDRRLLNAVDSLFGEHAAQASLDQVGLRSPGPGYGEQDLHRDGLDAMPAEPASTVTAIVALVEFTTRNGATRIIPGSHLTRRPVDAFRGRRYASDEQQLLGAAGTAWVFNGHVVHAGGRNDSDAPRPALQLVWRVAHPWPTR